MNSAWINFSFISTNSPTNQILILSPSLPLSLFPLPPTNTPLPHSPSLKLFSCFSFPEFQFYYVQTRKCIKCVYNSLKGK